MPPGLGAPVVPGVVDSSDPDLDEDRPSKSGKRRGQTSPTARRAEKPITLADLQRLLQEQSAQIQTHQEQQIKAAISDIQRTTGAQIQAVQSEVQRHGDYIDQLRDQGEKIEARLLALEAGGAGSLPERGREGDSRKNLMIFGGWGPDTHRDVLLAELKEMLQKVDCLKHFDDLFTTGPRRGNALGLVTQYPGEAEGELKRKMIGIAQTIRAANLRADNMQLDKNLWASLSKTKLERLRSSHAGKLKRLTLEVNSQEKQHIDVEWNAGSVWLRGTLIGSSTRTKPAGVVVCEGKTPQSWLDVTTTSRLLGCSEADLQAECANFEISDRPEPCEHTRTQVQTTPGSSLPEGHNSPEHQMIRILSWNIGGKPVQDALKAIEVTSSLADSIACFQELPRTQAGWQTTIIQDHFTLVQFRDDLRQWRGNGVMYRTGEFTCLRRKANHVGTWVKLRHTKTQAELWVGSARLSTGVTDDVVAEETQELLQLRPPRPNAAVLMADFNTKLCWSAGAGSRGHVRPTTGRADHLVTELEGRGDNGTFPRADRGDPEREADRLMVLRSRGFPLPTSTSRRKPSEKSEETTIASTSASVLRLRDGGIVSGQIPSTPSLDQETLMRLARDYTIPKPGTRYHDPPEVKTLYRQAKKSGTERAWKLAHKARRTAHDLWHRQKLERASQRNWKDYRELKQDRLGSTWAVHMSEEAFNKGKEPLQWTVDHFRSLFTEPGAQGLPEWQRDTKASEPFSMSELVEAVKKGKNGKAVGADLTSFELLKGLMQDGPTAEALLEWMEDIRQGRLIPREWLHTIVTLLPKVANPAGSEDLRPISLGSAIGKVYGTMLLRRTRAALQPAGPEQCSHSGRQTADYVFAAIRSFQLETEWRWGLHWVKLDIRKAFDSLNRAKALDYLRKALPESMHLEYKSWRQLLTPGHATVRTPWGEGHINQTRGIRQGAVESPWLFSVAMELSLHEAQAEEGWPRRIGAAPDLQLGELLFMDDSIIWAGDQKELLAKYHILKGCLEKWGLTVNPKKTAYYASPHATERQPLLLEGAQVVPKESLEVMGIALSIPLRPASLMDSALAKARKKHFANRGMLECRTPLKERLKMFTSTVGGAALWYSSAAPPSPQALGAVNSLQLELVSRMAGFRRRSSETWLEFHTRSRRAARQLLVSHEQPRWSTLWLQRYWNYKGHVARGNAREQPPASSVIDGFRTYQWWKQQQRLAEGLRHPASFYPYLSNDELRLNRAARCEDWRQLAMDPVAWRQAEAEWLRREDVSWTRGRQLALTGGAPLTPSTHPSLAIRESGDE
ncbi:unnamed protein product [Symbiodinium necroappetens]|uniref:Reverse transcriptase domain-containing protein n=1 Tax=Symbiodinium necroappetens TaxID=1628268 RepID=A0A812PKQ4_9DINO|nr:unnamed protein product [Symbiodinium necroappetens]